MSCLSSTSVTASDASRLDPATLARDGSQSRPRRARQQVEGRVRDEEDGPHWDVLRRFDRPVYYALGGRSDPDLYARIAMRLADVFADFTLERYVDRHHFDPPHRIEPARTAAALRALWVRAEERGPGVPNGTD